MRTDPDIEARAAARVQEIGELLSRQGAQLSSDLTEELLSRIPSLQGDPVIQDLLLASVIANLENVTYLLRGHVPLENIPVPAPAYEYARRLAQRGMPLGALLRAYRLGQRRIVDWAYGELAEIETDPAIAFAAGRSLNGTTFDYVDQISEGVVDAYQTEREQWLANRNTVRLEVLESVLAGDRVDVAVAESALGHRLRQHHLGLVVWRNHAGTGAHDLQELERLVVAIGQELGGTAAPLFISRDRGNAWAWLSLGRRVVVPDLAAVTALVSGTGADIRLALGTPGAGEDGFRTSHDEAEKAQRVAMAAGDHAPPVTSYDDAGVRAAALLTTDLDATRRMVAAALGGLAVDTEAAARLRETLLAFLRSGDSYVATADVIHLHKNTVKYRVDKAVEARGRPLDEDRLDLELALIACQWLAPEVLRPEP